MSFLIAFCKRERQEGRRKTVGSEEKQERDYGSEKRKRGR
jgi:hypothetical protein